MDAYVSKPIQSRLLFEAIENVVPSPVLAAGFEEKLPPDATTVDTKAYDREAALAMIDGDTELFGELVELFMTESVELLGQVRKAIAQHDAKGLERAAHSMKGSAAAFCGESARVVAQTLEDMGERGDFGEVEAVADELETEVRRLTHALAEYRKESVQCES